MEFLEGPCPASYIGVDLVRPLSASMIGCFDEDRIHANLQDLWFSRILPNVHRSFMSSHFTSVQSNPSIIDISNSDMASNQSAPSHPVHASSEVEVESARNPTKAIVLRPESEISTSPVDQVHGNRAEADSEGTVSTSSSSTLIPRRSRAAMSSQLDSEFGLTKNVLTETDLSRLRLTYGIDMAEYRLFLEREVTEMSSKAISIPMAHFEAGLHLPLDSNFIEFLIFIRAQPAHLHPNTVCFIMAFIVLCRRLGVGISANLVRHFFSSLRMVNNVLSMRPRQNVISLFDGLPNKIRWTNKWIMVEARHGFPFPLLIGQIRKWEALGSDTQWSDNDLKFLAIMEENLGKDPHKQEKCYRMDDMLSEASLTEAGIGTPEARRTELGLVGAMSEYNVWTLHPGRVFSVNCSTCMARPSAGFAPVEDESIFRLHCLCLLHMPFFFF